MLTLPAGTTIGAVASVAGTVACSVFGMTLTPPSVEVYEVLAQLQLPNAPAAIYTVPAGKTAFVRSITVVNSDAAASKTFQLFIGGLGAANAITPVFTIPNGGSAVYEDCAGWSFFNALGQLQGEGSMGEPGPAGVAGATGSAGATGPIGPAGGIGPTGLTGPAGAQGIQGLQGIQGEPGSGGETLATLAALHSSAPVKSALVDADEVTGGDSAAGFGVIRSTWTGIKAFLKTYFDTVYQDELVSSTNIKTVNGESILGPGDLAVGGSIAPLVVENANTVAQRNGTNPQTAYHYSSFIDENNWLRAYTRFNVGTNALEIGTEKLGSPALGTGLILKSGTFNLLRALNTSIGVGQSAVSAETSGSHNAGVGYSALGAVTTGIHNVAVGSSVLSACLGVNFNTAVGVQSLQYLTSGDNNTSIGWRAGTYLGDGATNNTSANGSVYVGFKASTLASGRTNEIVIGSNAVGAGSNTATLGDGAIVKTILRGVIAASTVYTVATLPTAASAGNNARSYVTDSTLAFVAANVGAAVVGGGVNHTPVIAVNGVWVIGG